MQHFDSKIRFGYYILPQIPQLGNLFAFAFVTGLSGALMPGPLLAYNVHAAAKHGAKAGFLVVVGHGILESTIVIAIFAGAREFLQNQATLRILAGAGSLALIVMALLMLRQAPKLSLSAMLDSEKPPSKIENPILGGFLLSLLNPGFPVWWIAVGLSITAKVVPTVPNITVFYAGHISSDFAWYILVAYLVGLGRRFISDRAYRIFIVVLALFLMAYACSFGYAAFAGVAPAAVPAA